MDSQIGYERFFDPDDIFFSVTDRKGVIRYSNRTFDTLSRYSREQLVGAPHNIIRHLDMPAGVFKLMWDDLEAGLPVSAYVLNRAADALDYRVFATIVPINEGYLSIRIKPQSKQFKEAVEQAYRRVRASELQVAAAGASRIRVGKYGAESLTRELAQLGYHSLHELTLATLPVEMSALIDAGVRVPAPTQVPGPVDTILRATSAVERDTNLLVFELEEYLRLLDSLTGTRDLMDDVAKRTQASADLLSDPTLRMPAKARSLAEQVVEAARYVVPELRRLPGLMSLLYQQVLELRHGVALMRLLTLMVGRFARSVLDGSEVEPTAAMTALCEALETGVVHLAPLREEVREGATVMDAELADVTFALDHATMRLRRWVDRRGGGRVPDDCLAQAQVLADKGAPEVRRMTALSAQCRNLPLPFDAQATRGHLATIRSALAELARTPQAAAGTR